MTDAISSFLRILDLEKLDRNLFRGMSPDVGWQRVFGGLVIAQALVAAARTVDDDRPVHSTHGYFMRPGDPQVPIIYHVDCIRDGKSFATRRVVAMQNGVAIFSQSASFQTMEDGLSHQFDMPQVPQPEDLPSEKELKARFFDTAPKNVRSYWQRERPIEIRPVDPTHYISDEKLPPYQNIWFRVAGTLPEDPMIHQAALAYASDMTLLSTALTAHGKSVFSPDIQAASLDHALWLHRPILFDDWLLYTQDSPASAGGRGFSRGQIYHRHGQLLASCTQEGLVRLRREKT